ncbi:unnamed protein product [Miscanthus lutarioriparius]|uniref:NB-ARC domain-containing protein n=1 Tax=Miscanthus lutarioriparius TaxID=422564 RepID=A0A811QIC4_9POAL|nr:unnamed protein product [Miscanthus lutarioriparius]
MEFATGALGTLLPKLGQLLQDEYNLHKGVKKDIVFVTRELESMRAALRDIGEDIVDTFFVRVQGSEPPSKRSIKRFIKKMTTIVGKAKTLHEISQAIKDIKERVKDVAERRDRIVSIVGFGGLGKTTLAKGVYDKFKPQFNCTAFVSMSRDPDIMKVLKDILYELDKKEYKDIHNTALGQQHLTDLVHEFLKNKRYLIVIDDIWDTEPWEIIRCALPENVLKSRIITTTRIIDVAEHVGGCYKLKPLTHHNSKMLFYGRIFGSESDCPKQFSDVSQKILMKCGGVPLAILTTSSLLANKSRNIKVWYDVCESVGKGLANNPSIDGMRKILLLSYYDLTPTLKTCLLYLSIFPEDYAIWWDRLILRWIAEGFVQQGDGRQSLYEIGQSYFNGLLNRSLIQPADMDEDEMNPFSCRVHDMVLDLICSLSREENFSTTISGDCMQMTSSENKAPRLSIHNTSWPTINMSKLRLQSSSSSKSRVCWYIISPEVSKPSRYWICWRAPKGDREATVLQTLDFQGTCIKEVPLSIFRLRQLMSLDVGDSSRLPTTSGLRNLSSLEQLHMNVDSTNIAEELGHLTQLRVLWVMLEITRKADGMKACAEFCWGPLANYTKSKL